MQDLGKFFMEFWTMICAMAPYLLLGFLIAGVLHVVVPSEFYRKYLTKNSGKSVVYAALLGIPLPLCSCGVIPTAIGLRNEKVSKGAVASFLIATPQTGIDSILATFSLMGLGFAIIRPVAALVTGVCGGLLVNRLLRKEKEQNDTSSSCEIQTKKLNPIYAICKYAFFEMLQNIGLRLLVGLLLATLISIFIPDEFFLRFADYPLLQMLIILLIAIPMYVCSTGSIPIAASLIMKGLSPGAALVMLMAGPAVNLASILVVKKTIGKNFTLIYVLTIVIGSVLFGLLVNVFSDFFVGNMPQSASMDCCSTNMHRISWFKTICAIIFSVLLINALVMKFLDRFKKTEKLASESLYRVEGMTCSHCKMSVEKAVMSLKNIEYAEADVNQKTLKVKGTASEQEIKKAVEGAGFTFKGEI